MKGPGDPKQRIIPSSCLFIHFHNSLLLDLGLTEWPPWREWPTQKVLNNFLNTKRSALLTTERNARLRDTWNKLKKSANVFHGLWQMNKQRIRYISSNFKLAIAFSQIDPLLQEISFCGPEHRNCVTSPFVYNKSCLVPCDGLYADIDSLKKDLDSLRQDLVKGTIWEHWFDMNISVVKVVLAF